MMQAAVENKSLMQLLVVVEERETKRKQVERFEKRILNDMEKLSKMESEVSLLDDEIVKLLEVEGFAVPTDKYEYIKLLSSLSKEIPKRYERSHLYDIAIEYLKTVGSDVSLGELKRMFKRLGYELNNWSELMCEALVFRRGVIERTRRGYYKYIGRPM